MTLSQFYYMRAMHDNENRITIRSNVKKALPILWCRGGEYRLIPREVLYNAIVLLAEMSKTFVKTLNPLVYIYWDQGIPINNVTGRALAGE